MKVYLAGKNSNQALKSSDPTSIESVAAAAGMDLVSTLNSETDMLICVDYERGVEKLARRASRLGVPTALIVNEPNVVIPQHAQPRKIRLFDRVIKVGRSAPGVVVRWPQTIRPLNRNTARLERAVIVNADKWSFVKGQLYWLRAAITEGRDDLDLYGFGWARPNLVRAAHRIHDLLRTLISFETPSFEGIKFSLVKPRNFLGAVGDKLSVMRNYKVAIVIENSEELLTEKLFDAWIAGCIPVYVGPSVSCFELNPDLVIQCSPNLEEISAAIDKALTMNYPLFLAKLETFLDNRHFVESWRGEVAIRKILDLACGVAET